MIVCPVLVDRSSGEEAKAWPVRYERMFDMTNDSHLFRTREELEEREGAWPIGGNSFDSPKRQVAARSTRARWCRRSITARPA